jgi:hypothetical protein
MLSGPDALEGFILHRSFATPSCVILMLGMFCWTLFNDKIKKMLRKKQSLYNQAKRTKNWSNYKHYQKECKRQIRKAEWNYINSAILDVWNVLLDSSVCFRHFVDFLPREN